MRSTWASGGNQQLNLGFGEEDMTIVQTLDETAEHGEVFTRRWIVDLILDLVGYTPDRDLGALVLVEPSCGAGAFLTPVVERLIESCLRHERPLATVATALQAFDLLPANVELAQKAVASALADAEVPVDDARAIASRTVQCADFLLRRRDDASVDFVVGNPPYIRLEDVPAARGRAYRRACPTMRGRSDIFVGFIEVGLRMLRPNGALGFIVADRWMHNQYGADLRQLVSAAFSVETVLSMHDVDAFEERVSAYPAVTVIRAADQGAAVVASATRQFDEKEAVRFRRWTTTGRKALSTESMTATRLPGWFPSDASWPSGPPQHLPLLADLERRLPPLEDASSGTRVGIGVASGADSVYLTSDPGLVEKDRLLPLLTTKDIASGTAAWSGTYLVNPWDEGRLVDLADHPRLATYLAKNGAQIRGRHVAKNNPARWFRTIDRVEPGLLETPKLVIPDLKSYIQPVLDHGRTYPHHGLYFVTSDRWDLEVLGGLLLSEIAEMFVSMYCVKMRGGCYRFQAQYLRRIRVPAIETVGTVASRELREAFADRDRERATSVARRLYGVPDDFKMTGR
jgi:adenine-specific DNA-methyltransferase